MAHGEDQRKQGVSPELDELSSELMGDALDMLAEGENVNVLLVVEDAKRSVASYEFADDGPEECLEGARAKVHALDRAGGSPEDLLGAPVRYALVYEGAIADDAGAYHDALILEFGERGQEVAFTGFVLYDGFGRGEGFSWSDAQAAGETEPLL